ncbi:MAG TPA: hypothetical protein ENN39_05615 [Desulfonatronum sp.]|nr:hypothetical protein [Desulfonatronum sp.]
MSRSAWAAPSCSQRAAARATFCNNPRSVAAITAASTAWCRWSLRFLFSPHLPRSIAVSLPGVTQT